MASKSHSIYQSRVKYMEQCDPNFVRKRKHFFVTCILRGFVSGLQYGVIVPSAWAYVKMFHSPTWLFGVLLASSRITAAFASLVLGRLYDKTKRLRCIIIVVNIVDILGSLLYTLPLSIWFLLAGRILSGIGVGFTTATSSEIAWITLEKKRSTIYARVLAGFICGLTFGPPLAALSQQVELHIFQLKIDYRNFPGLISAFLWLLMLPISWFLVQDLARRYVDVESEKMEICEDIIQTEIEASLEEEDLYFNSHEEIPQPNISSEQNEESKSIVNSNREEEDGIPGLTDIIREVFSPELIILFVTNAFAYTYVISGDTGIPLFTQEIFGWKVIYTSVGYIVLAIENIIIYTIIGVVGEKVDDSCWIKSGYLCMIASSVVFLLYQQSRANLQIAVPLFCTSTLLGIAFWPLFEVGGKSLLTKVIPMKSQGAIQGVYDLSFFIGSTLGPMWGIFFYHHVYTAASTSLVLISGCLIWFLLSGERLRLRMNLYSTGDETCTEK